MAKEAGHPETFPFDRDAEEALRESEERFRLVFDQSTEAIVLADPSSGRLLYVNRTLERLLGYPVEMLLEEGAPLLYRHFKDLDLKGLFTQNTTSDDFISTRVRTVGAGGAPLVVSVRVKHVKMRGSNLVHFSLRDMTEKARLEEEARKAQARLIHANKMSALGLLVSGVAHEINNPNNFIMFNSSMLADIWCDADRILDEHYRASGVFDLGGIPYPEIGEATRKLIEGVREGAQRIKTTVESLKDFARQDDSGLNQPLDLNRAVLKAVSILTPEIKKNCGKFSVNLNENLPLTCGNPQQVEQVVMNLLLNALQSLPSRDSFVSVTTSLNDAGCLVAEVRDRGNGMDAETLKRLSEPFFTTKSASGGTGLGLHISQTIAREHGGQLLFASQPGQGTSASLELPQRQLEEGR